MPITIEKKVWSELFKANRKQRFALRLADFELEKGDKIVFKAWDKEKQKYTGKEYAKKVTSVSHFPSPNRFWTQEDLEKYGLYVIELA